MCTYCVNCPLMGTFVCYLHFYFPTNFYEDWFSGMCMKLCIDTLKKNPEKSGIQERIKFFVFLLSLIVPAPRATDFAKKRNNKMPKKSISGLRHEPNTAIASRRRAKRVDLIFRIEKDLYVDPYNLFCLV